MGSFSSQQNAQNAVDQFAARMGEPLVIEEISTDLGPRFRVRTQPSPDLTETAEKIDLVRSSLVSGAWLLRTTQEIPVPETASIEPEEPIADPEPTTPEESPESLATVPSSASPSSALASTC